MGELNGMSTEDRVAVDRVFERLSGGTHYEVLKVPSDAPWEVIEQALRDLRRRCDPARFVGIPSDEYRYRIDAIVRAFDEASEVLSDPVRRFLYDQQTLRGGGRRGLTPPPPQAVVTPIPPRTGVSNPQIERLGRPVERESPSVRPPAPDSPLVVPAPLKRESTVPEARGSYRPSGNRPSVAPGRPEVVVPVDPVAPRAAPADEAYRRDLGALLVEVERIAVAVQFCIAQTLDPQAERVPALQTAGQALADTRAALASIQARREEEAGRWSDAASNWLRASRARPQDATILARLAEALSRAGDTQAANDAARRALTLDPSCEAARSTLSAIARR